MNLDVVICPGCGRIYKRKQTPNCSCGYYLGSDLSTIADFLVATPNAWDTANNVNLVKFVQSLAKVFGVEQEP